MFLKLRASDRREGAALPAVSLLPWARGRAAGFNRIGPVRVLAGHNGASSFCTTLRRIRPGTCYACAWGFQDRRRDRLAFRTMAGIDRAYRPDDCNRIPVFIGRNTSAVRYRRSRPSAPGLWTYR